MTDCPVCGEPFEYREIEDPGGENPGVSIEVDDLVEVDPATRWNRICARAAASEDDGAAGARLEVYRHHWGSTD